MRAANGLRLASTHPGRITWPTLLLHGGESPYFFKAAMAHLAGVIPDTRSVALAGQQHVAMDTAPRLLADEVIGFWMEVRG